MCELNIQVKGSLRSLANTLFQFEVFGVFSRLNEGLGRVFFKVLLFHCVQVHIIYVEKKISVS